MKSEYIKGGAGYLTYCIVYSENWETEIFKVVYKIGSIYVRIIENTLGI